MYSIYLRLIWLPKDHTKMIYIIIFNLYENTSTNKKAADGCLIWEKVYSYYSSSQIYIMEKRPRILRWVLLIILSSETLHQVKTQKGLWFFGWMCCIVVEGYHKQQTLRSLPRLLHAQIPHVAILAIIKFPGHRILFNGILVIFLALARKGEWVVKKLPLSEIQLGGGGGGKEEFDSLFYCGTLYVRNI